MSCLSMGLREMILLVLLVRPTNRWRDVGDSDTLTALLSRLNKTMTDHMINVIMVHFTCRWRNSLPGWIC